jgi:hypothetical protein
MLFDFLVVGLADLLLEPVRAILPGNGAGNLGFN